MQHTSRIGKCIINTLTPLKMVNTFVIHRDYGESAKKLDLIRLRKQIVEAYQIHDILDSLSQISEIEGWDNPPDIDESDGDTISVEHTRRVEWAISTRKKYLGLNYRYAVIDGEVLKFPKTRLPYKLKREQKYCINSDGSVSIWVLPQDEEEICSLSAKKIPRDKSGRGTRTGYILPRISVVIVERGDRLWTLGFSQHAAVKMWAGYLPSLKEYINAHIDEYNSRDTPSGDRKCSICLGKFDVDESVKPWWIVETTAVIHSHRASLLRKELDRAEDEWYWNDDDIVKSKRYMHRGYMWVGSFGENSVKYINTIIQHGKNISKLPDEFFSPVQTFVLSQNQLRKKYSYTGKYELDQSGYVVVDFIKDE